MKIKECGTKSADQSVGKTKRSLKLAIFYSIQEYPLIFFFFPPAGEYFSLPLVPSSKTSAYTR